MGLRTDSKIVGDNLATIPLKALEMRIGTCGLMNEVDTTMRLTLGLD
jgi:hypothetical protein